eukprot:Skav226507  [mRNA]  locus=scaffold1773:20573:21295:+ [translate_table: standard]
MRPNKTGRDVGPLSCFKQIIFPMESGPMQSTIQADFIRHANYEPTKIAVKDTASILTKDQAEGHFQGLSCYIEDYNHKSATCRPTPVRTSGPIYSRHFLQHAGCDKFATTYGEHFVRRNPSDGGVGHTFDIRSSSIGPFRRKPFQGQTSYAQHFPKPEKSAASEAIRAGGDNQSTLTDAARACIFDSQSIYQESFLKHRTPGKQENLRPLGALHGGQAFSGTSEYKSVFTTWPRLEKWRY